MKQFLTILSLVLLTAANVHAQQTAPRTEYAVALSEDAITLKPGESKTITLTLLKSKQYSKGKVALAFSSSIPQGLTVSYDPAEGVIDSTTVTVVAANDAKEGSYQVILKSSIHNRIKGTVLKITVAANGSTQSGLSQN
jgi:hypothetical protein